MLHPLLLALIARPLPVCVFNHLVSWNALGSITINHVGALALWKSVSSLILEYSFDLLVEWILLSKDLRPLV